MIPNASGTELLAWVFRRRRRMRVRGPSMEPTLHAGDVVFVDTAAYDNSIPTDGDVVVAIHPHQPKVEIVKRVEFSDDGGVYLRSDNDDATDADDSRRFGLVAHNQIVGRVTATAAAQR